MKEMDENIKRSKNLKELGVNPYEYGFNFTEHISNLEKDTKNSIAGRLIEYKHEKDTYEGVIEDRSGRVQFTLKPCHKIQEELLRNITQGDIIGLEGRLLDSGMEFKTDKISILTKSLIQAKTPSSEEERHEFKHVEMINNPKLRKRLIKRAEIVQSFRDYLNKESYIEVETPSMHPYFGGSSADAFTTRYNTLGHDFFLAVSPELYLKRLIVGGLERVYTISKNFRDEKIDHTHSPEFTSIEYYSAYSDYNDMMELTENMVLEIVKKISGSEKMKFNGNMIDYSVPWKRVTIKDSIDEILGINMDEKSDDFFRGLLTDYGFIDNYEKAKEFSRYQLTMSTFDNLVQPGLIQPTFAIDYPKESTPACYSVALCKTKRENNNLLERFELFIGGMELANAYSELNDAVYQKNIFEEQKKNAVGRNKAVEMDPYFNHALMVGMPPTGGVGIGIDRIVMLLTDTPNIRDTIAFPMIKKEYL